MDRATEKQRIEEHYARMADGELEDVASEAYELTAVAREALTAELQKRGLSVDVVRAKPVPAQPPEPVVVPESEPDAEDNDGIVEYQDLVLLKRFRDLPEAMMAKGMLDSSGLKCYLVDDNMVRMNWFISNLIGGVRLMVKPEDLRTATEVLSQPIPEGIDYGEAEQFEQPRCPKCGSIDITFEELNKPLSYGSAWLGFPLPISSPKWKCENCGAKWVEDEDESPEIDEEKEEPQP